MFLSQRNLRDVTWLSDLAHETLWWLISHQGVGSNPGHDTCLLEQDICERRDGLRD